MRRRKVVMPQRKPKAISIKAHPDLYNEMERLRKRFGEKGIYASQLDLTKCLADKLKKRKSKK